MDNQINVYSTSWCPDCKRAKDFFQSHRIQYNTIDIEKNPQGMAYVRKVNHGKSIIPTIVFPDGTILAEPSNPQLAEKLGLQTKASLQSYDAIIIGGLMGHMVFGLVVALLYVLL